MQLARGELTLPMHKGDALGLMTHLMVNHLNPRPFSSFLRLFDSAAAAAAAAGAAAAGGGSGGGIFVRSLIEKQVRP